MIMFEYSICLFCCNVLVLLERSRRCHVVWPKKCAGEEIKNIHFIHKFTLPFHFMHGLKLGLEILYSIVLC